MAKAKDDEKVDEIPAVDESPPAADPQPAPTPETAEQVVADINAGIDIATGLPINPPEPPAPTPSVEAELAGIANAGSSQAALITALTPGAPIIPNPDPVPNTLIARDPESLEVSTVPNSQPVIAMQVGDYKREMSNKEALRAKALNSDNRGGVYGIRNPLGEIVVWVDGNGVQVEAPDGFEDNELGE